jgi:hypothetical protein
MYGRACKKATEVCDQILQEKKDAAITQRTTLLQKEQRLKELNFKEKQLSQTLTMQEAMEQHSIEMDNEVGDHKLKYGFTDAKTLKALEQSKAPKEAPKQLDLKEFISKEKKQPEKKKEKAKSNKK